MKPVDLIVTNAMHDFAEAVRNVAPDRIDADHALRILLCKISHDASMPAVSAALAAVAAPATTADFMAQLQSVRERRHEQGLGAAPASGAPVGPAG
jgi:hypothetical protein